jgi:hypothetical protein
VSAELSIPWLLTPAKRLRGGRPSSITAPRMAMAALRIPHGRGLDVGPGLGGGPRIFVHEGSRQALERRLGLAFQGPVQLAVTDNLRRMVTRTRLRGTLKVRVHMMFLGAPERVRQALVEYVVRGTRHASGVLGDFIEKNQYRIRASQPILRPLSTRGQVHDLGAILAEVSARYFPGSASDVLITWGRRTRPFGDARRTIKLGSYSATERLVRIHPALDRAWVPRYFVASIVHHELLHHIIPMTPGGVHPPELLRLERQFPLYERAREWEHKNVARLLRSK